MLSDNVISTKPDINISQFTIYSSFKGQTGFSFIKPVGIICKKVKVKILELLQKSFTYNKNNNGPSTEP